MKEHPITLSEREVHGILKHHSWRFPQSQIRRPLRPQPPVFNGRWYQRKPGDVWYDKKRDAHQWHFVSPSGKENTIAPIRVPYVVGDHLWVKETYADVHPLQIAEGRYSQKSPAGIPGPPGVTYRTIYRADGEYPPIWHAQGHPYRALKTDDPIALKCDPKGVEYGWNNLVCMPRHASRLFLVVTAIRIERLQDIREEDAMSQGCGTALRAQLFGVSDDDAEPLNGLLEPSYRNAFASYWDAIYGKAGQGWTANPWVRVTEFAAVATDTFDV